MSQLAEENVPKQVTPESNRNLVLGEQALVADQNIVLSEFGAKRRANRRSIIHRDLSELSESALVA